MELIMGGERFDVPGCITNPMVGEAGFPVCRKEKCNLEERCNWRRDGVVPNRYVDSAMPGKRSGGQGRIG
jgi:hypothetical protein